MNCKNCGSVINSEDLFCYKCGTKVNNNDLSIKKARKKTFLKVFLFIIGILLLLFAIFIITLYIEFNKDVVYQSGKVIIGEDELQLPCSISSFENQFSTIVNDGEFVEEIMNTNVNTSNGTLYLDLYVNDDMITGIILNAYISKVSSYDKTLDQNERDVAKQVVFPGNITIESDISEINDLYKTKPFNINYDYFSEKISLSKTSARHYYRKYPWNIEFHMTNNEIDEISYYTDELER